MDQTETAFTVWDALGLARLAKRRGDLGGSVPLRVARGCDPLFEGNAFGFQITLTHPMTLRRGPQGWGVEMDPAHAALAARQRGVLSRLAAQGCALEGLAGFADRVVQLEPTAPGHARVRLWTGLCVRPDTGVWLRVSATANRRNRALEVAEHFIPDGGACVPLILSIGLSPHTPDRVNLVGEIATLAPVAPGARIVEVPLVQAPEIGAAHTAFYDKAYYETKRGQVTRKYRKLSLPAGEQGDAPARCRVVTVGPSAHTLGTHPVADVTFANLVPFEATYDGYSFSVASDQRALQAGADAVEQAFEAALGPLTDMSPRALLYFTKYFTLHPPGEPHFFVKPWAFMQTPPGWSSLLEGLHGDGFDVLRGVVATDVFHATPAVFQVDRMGTPIQVGLGQPLLRVIPIPRRLITAGFREVALSD